MPVADPFYEKIAAANAAHALFSPTDTVLAALSGGADSVAMLVALKEFFPKLTLVACHVNHGLRGEEADRDEAFARALCERLGVPFESVKLDVAAFAKAHALSTELAARQLRYDFFEKICRKRGISLVATAHTASDNAETVLYNLTRGAALAGLCGIPPKRKLAADITLIRPLLFASRCDVEAFLQLRGESYVTDSTNLTDAYTRNFFRHNVLPLLKQVNPSLEQTLGNTCTALRNTQIFIEKTANNSMTDDVPTLASLDVCVRRQIVLNLYHNATGKTLLENVHIEAIDSLILSAAIAGGKKNAEICLPGKVSAVIRGSRLLFEPTVRKARAAEKVLPRQCDPLPLGDGLQPIPGTPFAVYASARDFLTEPSRLSEIPAGFSLYDSVYLDKSAVRGKLILRIRKPGDTIHHAGMTKKLKSLFNHSTTPPNMRDMLPLVCDDDGVLYVPRIAVSDPHRYAFAAAHKLRILIYQSASPS